MPALSPTMTEGNIASWQLKEGDSFTAGHDIPSIETDKATMDVEAQDDGVLFKIMQPDGSKGVKVGQRIAVLAEAGDDLGSLEIPADEKGASGGQAATKKAEEEGDSTGKEKGEEIGGSREIDSGAASAEISKPLAETPPRAPSGSTGQKQDYPLFPSVQQLLHQNGLSDSEADKIPASGPQGRLLKGDVLAYLGKINKDYPSQSSARLEKLTHLDLSNIQLAKPQPKQEAPAAAPALPGKEVPEETEVAVPISLSAVIATQKRVQDTLGIFLPLSTFVARASELANEDLPTSKFRKPTADDLFNSVLGLDTISTKVSRGHFIPQITSISPPPIPAVPRRTNQTDIIDVLVAPSKARTRSVPTRDIPAALGISAGDNVFSVTTRVEDKERANEYLERLKVALEKEPGRLVL